MFYLHVCCCRINILANTVRKLSSKNNTELLMDIFGFPRSVAEACIEKRKNLATKDPEQIIESYQYCKKIGFSNDDILENLSLLTTHPIVKYHHYWVLEESGCKPIGPKLLSRTLYYVRKEIQVLKSLKFMEPDVNVADRFMSYLSPPIKKPKVLDKNLDILDQMRWTEIHKYILEEWLRVRLNATTEDLVKLFRIHKMIRNKSFRIIEENISLAESLGLSHTKILKCGYLLNNYPEYPKTVLREFPNLAGLDMRKAMKNNPKLQMVAPKNILQIYGILKENGISDELIQKKHSVFSMSVETVKFRLKEIQRIPELRFLLHSNKILNLLVHQSKVKSRLSFLQKLQLKCASFHVITSLTKDVFDKYIREGKDVNIIQDVKRFFVQMFDKNPSEIMKKIKLHPYSCYVPFVSIQDTYDFLTACGYTKENIYRVMHIVLYPRNKIIEAMKELKCQPDVKFDLLSQTKRLQLILYQIEKEHHFTGNGIWSTDPVQAQLDEKTLE